MTSFKEQMALHDASRQATAALELAARSQISRIFSQWEAGEHTGASVRFRLEDVIRQSYRSSAAVAASVAERSSGIPGWRPVDVFNTAYLQSLIADVRQNLRQFKNGVLTREQAIYRMEHSAGVAAQRGYTDQMVASYTELEDFGFDLRKYWVANFVNNTPCTACTRLHATAVGLHEYFHAMPGESSVYINLIGPPRHPRCQCKLYIFIVTLENTFERPNFEVPDDSPVMLSTSDVKKLPRSVFEAARATLTAVLKFLRRN